jgi:hypothetical protein
MFLHSQHKDLQLKYKKEQENAKIVEQYRKRLAEVIFEKEQIDKTNVGLQMKVCSMSEIIRLAVEE